MKISAYTDKIMEHHHKGQNKGCTTGFSCLDQLISFKPKYTTYIQGFPRSGKTEIHLELLFNLTRKNQWKHALMSPEIGGVEDVIAELISKYLRKPFFKSTGWAPSEREIYSAINHLEEYFFVLDNDENDYTVDSFYEDCKKIEVDNGIKLNTTSIDPWNDLEEDLPKYGGREDKYLSAALRKVRATAKANLWHNFIVTHSKEMPSIELKSADGGKVVCTAIPTLQSFAGGQVWSRRGFNVIGMWKPEKTAINKRTGLQFLDNEAIVSVLKSKPKGTGSLGRVSLFFDWKKNRYYELYEGKECYAFDHETVEKEPEIEIVSLVEPKIIEKPEQKSIF